MRTKKKRTYSGRLLRAKRPYDFKDIAEVLGVHLQTVRAWKKEGLTVLDDKKPFLVMGQDLRDFFKARRQSRKKPLKIGEFYCPRCREPRRSRPDRLTAQVTQRRLGKDRKQVLIRGICETCGQRLLLFSSDRKAAEWPKNGLALTERRERLNGIKTGSVKTDILKGGKHGKSERAE